jgi:HrpA-like RNA helicase
MRVYGLLRPQIEECASILSKFVQRSGNTKRLLVTSAALTETSVKQCFGQASGFLAITTRRFALHRCVDAPLDKPKLLNVCAQLVVTALSRRDGNVINFLPGLKEITTVQRLVYETAASTCASLQF